MKFKPITISEDELLSMSYRDIMIVVYDAIPGHDLELNNNQYADLCGYYAHLYMQLSKIFSYIIEKYSPSENNKYKLLKNSIEQAIKVVKFQYDTMSRKYTMLREEEDTWKHTV